MHLVGICILEYYYDARTHGHEALLRSFLWQRGVSLCNTLIVLLGTEIVTGLRVGRQRNRGSIPERDRRSLLQIV